MMSLRRSLVCWLLPLLLCTLGLNAIFAYADAMRAVNLAYDRTLSASIRAIAERIYVKDGKILSDIPYSALDAFEGSDQERVFYAVLGPDSRPLTGYTDLPVRPGNMAPTDRVEVYDASYRDEKIRVGVLRKRLFAPELAGHDVVQVVVAETTESRQALVRRLFIEGVWRDAMLVLVVAVALALLLWRIFNPLLSLRRAIEARGADDLTPIPVDVTPKEVRPLIDAINLHTARIARMIGARKRFLADAAHQLRTPLAVLSTQVDYALRQSDPRELQQTLEGLRESIRRMRHMTNQMLSLSRAESANGLVLETQRVDLARIVREAALEITPLVMARAQELAYQGPERGLFMQGHAGMLHELLLNLLDNALRYTPEGGQISIVLCEEAPDLCLDIIDSGPGIPVTERENVFARFHRLLGQGNSSGSGLGLSIVREICLAHGGQIALADGTDGKGLKVSLRFPLSA